MGREIKLGTTTTLNIKVKGNRVFELGKGIRNNKPIFSALILKRTKQTEKGFKPTTKSGFKKVLVAGKLFRSKTSATKFLTKQKLKIK